MNGNSGWEAGPRRRNEAAGCGGPRATASLIFGSVAMLAGALLLLDRFGLVEFDAIFRFWPVALLVLGGGLLLRGGRSGIVPGVILGGLGALFLARSLGYSDVRPWDLWPVLLIVVGATILANSIRTRRSSPEQDMAREQDVINDWALFGGVNKTITSPHFQGGELFAVFGGIEVNLRRSRISQPATVVVNANAFFGGIVLFVPEDWNVVNEGVAILGGFADSRRFVETRDEAEHRDGKTLIVRGIAALGGVEVKN